MTAPMVDYKIHWLKMMSVPESRAVVGRHDGINGRDNRLIEWFALMNSNASDDGEHSFATLSSAESHNEILPVF